eukprot:4319133-Ditylum_brightwellii.AAC.1
MLGAMLCTSWVELIQIEQIKLLEVAKQKSKTIIADGKHDKRKKPSSHCKKGKKYNECEGKSA